MAAKIQDLRIKWFRVQKKNYDKMIQGLEKENDSDTMLEIEKINFQIVQTINI